jgi:hypothetical protein
MNSCCFFRLQPGDLAGSNLSCQASGFFCKIRAAAGAALALRMSQRTCCPVSSSSFSGCDHKIKSGGEKKGMRMNHLIRLKTATSPLLIMLALVSFGLLPNAQAVNPPPDGGYANFTTAEGTNALNSLTTGAANTGVGWSSLLSVSTGSFNTGVGAATLVFNTADSNTATGVAALLLNTTGTENTANGTATLVNNSIGSFNTAFGAFALNNSVDGSNNTAIGNRALLSNTNGHDNTAVGQQALLSNAGGTSDQGSENTAVGAGALLSNTTGSDNTAVGTGALVNNNDNFNTATGARALLNNTTGNGNTATGSFALLNNDKGNSNTAVGGSALVNNTTGTGNTALGVGAGLGVFTANSVICIDHPGQDVSNSCFIGQIFGETSSGGTAVFINSDGKLGTTTSSRRFKEGIKPLDQASRALFSLKPVAFRYKKEIDPTGRSQFGLVAEEVEKVNPDLVVRDKEGKPYSVRYDQVNAMLLNEFLKEHRRNEKQEATIARLQKQIEALTAGLQKVSAQLELSKPGSRAVVNNQ